jgi:hypothetical protein
MRGAESDAGIVSALHASTKSPLPMMIPYTSCTTFHASLANFQFLMFCCVRHIHYVW